MNLLPELTNHPGRIAAFVGFATYLAIRGVLRKHPDDPIKYHQLLKTPFIGLVAGVAASTMASTPGGMVGMGILAGATKVVNDAWDSYLPPKFGGSNTHGFGADLDVDLRETNPLLDRVAGMIEDALRKVLAEDGYSVMMVDEKSRLAETSDTDPREDTARPEERDHPDAPEPSESTESGDGPLKTMVVHPEDKVDQWIREADYRTLQKVGGEIADVDGSGRADVPVDEQLRNADPKTVLTAFDIVTRKNDSAGEDAFQLRE